jgi:phosphoglucomutase
MREYEEKYRQWLDLASDDPDLHAELVAVSGSEEEITDRFYRDLEFGTGGLRGILGAGTNRMNVYTVARVTQGYANDLKARFSSPSVAIAHDSRIKSDLIARTAARVFAANGVRVWIFRELAPTPVLSFTVRRLGCSGGVVVTASHNPARYNGYKVYGADGCQFTLDDAARTLAEIEAVDIFSGVRMVPFEEGLENGMIAWVPDAVSDAYLEAVSALSLCRGELDRTAPIVYTPLNGAGYQYVTRCLAQNGFTNVVVPDEQKDPDGNFPTCPYPNPEAREALEVGLKWAEKTRSELLVATDPDSDRMGAAVRNAQGGYTLISGNQMSILLFDYVCRRRTALGIMPDRPVMVKTVVSNHMVIKLPSITAFRSSAF